MSVDMEWNKKHLARKIEHGVEVIANARAVLVRSIEELDRYAELYANPIRWTNEEQVLSSVANHLSTYILGNIRLDLMVSTAAEIARARAFATDEETE